MTDITARLRARAFRLAAQDMNGDGAKLAIEAADEIERLRARVDELQSKCRCVDCHEPTGHPCSDCGAPSEPATLCSSCATSRCIELGIVAAAEQRKRDADICRQIHSTSRQRTELALLCARMIE